MNSCHTALPKVHETVVHMLLEAATAAPNLSAIVFEGRELTYGEFLDCVARFSNELVSQGAAGERVALVAGNSLDFAIALFAIHAARAQAVPINPLYTERELRQVLGDCTPVAVLYDATLADKIVPVMKEFGLGVSIALGDNARLLDDWPAGPEAALPIPLPKADDLATLQYTGGTTGVPKGVNISHGQMAVNISQREAVLPTVVNDERIICVMPLFHVFAVSMCLHLAVYCRGQLVILPRYRPDIVLQTIEQHRITRLPAGPTIFIGLMAHEAFGGADLSSLRSAYSGSAALPQVVLDRWRSSTACPIYEGYGQSEAGPVLTYQREADTALAGSVGKALPGTDVEIVDTENGVKVLGHRQLGEIRARGPQIMSGYRNRPEETANSLRDGWLYTGDIGEIDQVGNLYIRDRKKDLVIVSGYNVYPREVEDVIRSFPAVSDVAVFGVQDDYRGEVLQASVVPQAGAQIDFDILRDYCEKHLARYKVPLRFQITEELPRTTVGKIDKVALRDKATPVRA